MTNPDERPANEIEIQRVRKAFGAYREAVKSTGERRYELGMALIAVRSRWPARGPKARGWGEFLAAENIDQDVALTAMRYAGYVEDILDHDFPPGSGSDREISNYPTLAEAGLRESEAKSTAPSVQHVPRLEIAVDDSEVEIDRDTWCTPQWIADALGTVDLDPCSNDRSVIKAKATYRLDRGEDGLALASRSASEQRVFVNPPYSDVTPWIRAYAHVRFCFLLKFDPSTKWFAELIQHTKLVLLPRGQRVQFIPPPGVPKAQSQANPFPHALFFARPGDATTALLEACYAWKVR